MIYLKLWKTCFNKKARSQFTEKEGKEGMNEYIISGWLVPGNMKSIITMWKQQQSLTSSFSCFLHTVALWLLIFRVRWHDVMSNFLFTVNVELLSSSSFYTHRRFLQAGPFPRVRRAANWREFASDARRSSWTFRETRERKRENRRENKRGRTLILRCAKWLRGSLTWFSFPQNENFKPAATDLPESPWLQVLSNLVPSCITVNFTIHFHTLTHKLRVYIQDFITFKSKISHQTKTEERNKW